VPGLFGSETTTLFLRSIGVAAAVTIAVALAVAPTSASTPAVLRIGLGVLVAVPVFVGAVLWLRPDGFDALVRRLPAIPRRPPGNR
jgi:hypothetical protein